MNETQLIESKELRDKVVERIDVLEKVKQLILLPNTEYATTKMVAEYYTVGEEAIKAIVFNNDEELTCDGMLRLTGNKTKEVLVSCGLQLTNFRGYFECNGQKFANRQNLLFTRRAILRVGMLLRDSEVAKEIRTYLLNVESDTQQQ